MSNGFEQTLPRRHLLITQRLRQRRGDLGLTQQQVVTRLAAAGLSTTNRALSSLEHGAGLEAAKLPGLADALECTVTYLVGLTDDPHRWAPDRAPDARPEATTSPPAPAAVEGPPARSRILGADVPDRGPLRLDGRAGGP